MTKDKTKAMTKMDEDRQINWRPKLFGVEWGREKAGEGIKDLIDMTWMDLDDLDGRRLISCLSIWVPHNLKLYDSILSTN